uniref:TIR domain-containing protein n=1 Tax=Neogobius melanostomus TaxID=47308 RepID=A0A8C6TDK2_9GOBI
MEPLFSLLFLLLLPRPSWLYSLHNCSINAMDPRKINCRHHNLSEFPPDILKSVLYLSLKFYGIELIRQSDFSGLSELQTLDLGSSEIAHIADAAFSHLSSLSELSLFDNRLTNLTDHMFTGLSNLTVLRLGCNNISHISELAFAPLTKLQTLDLSINPLTSLESEQFPLTITYLDLSYTSLSRFTLHSDVFPHLQTLKLGGIYSDLHWDVSDKAFLKSLRTLSLSQTQFSAETYQLIFQSLDSLKDLDLSQVYTLDIVPLDRACRIDTLQKLSLSNNYILVLKDSLLLPCSNLTELDLSINYLTELAASSLQMFTRLSWLNLRRTGLTEVPQTIRNMSSLTSLTLRDNSISKLRCLDFSGLRLLKFLNLSENKIRELNSCVFQDLQNLQELNIAKNLIQTFDDSFGTALPSLLVLNAARNHIYGAFDGLTNLRTLSISPVTIIYSPSPGVGPQSSFRGRSGLQTFFNLPSLQKLDLTVPDSIRFLWLKDFLKGLGDLEVLSLQHCFYGSPTPEAFCHTPHLLQLEIRKSQFWLPNQKLFQPLSVLQTLDLSENGLKTVDFLSEANLTQLQTLILKSNDLSVINDRVFEALPSLRYLDLGITRLNTQVYVNGAYEYKCESPGSHQGALLLEFDYRWCWESVGFFCFLCSSALVLLTLLLTFLHHFLRFHLLYSFYLLRAFLYHRQQRGCAEIYDAFVSYNVHDEEWVYRELLPELEGRQGWKLCLHHRDFEPGKAIMDNIVDAIYSSRKTLCVISHQYLLSEWCSREIQMASFRLLDEQKDVLILLFLEELSSNQLSPFFRMRKLMRSRTYLSWSGARGHRGLFWERVRHALQSGAQLPADDPLPTDD